MSLLAWNCQGLGSPWTVRQLGAIIQDHHPALVFLAETKCSSRQIDKLKHRFDMHGVNVDSVRKSGGLALLWDKHIERPWLCAGDFNEILEQSEEMGGPPRPLWQIRNFRRALEECSLSDIGFSGQPFTWSNRQEHPYTIRERLDRACASLRWIDLYPNATVTHLPASGSDHIPLLIKLSQQPASVGNKIRPFRFEAAWLESEQCEKVVSESWGGLYQPKGAQEASDIREELEKLAAHEETFWKQRGKALWLKEEDRNTTFFHMRASHCFRTNLISKLKNTTGAWVYEEKEIQQCIVSYFQNLFSSNNPNEDDIARGTENLRRVVDTSMEDDLLRPYSEDEVTKALFLMAPLKSPGPDGKQGYMAMKLDVSKAYDKVEWAFLEQKVEMDGPIRGVSICRNAPYISHLLFADDTLIFSQASSDSATHIKEILEIYRMASGQEINFQKSSVAFSKNCCEEAKRAIVLELEIPTENKMELYLGLPSRAARSKKELFSSIRDKVWKRINGWNEKILSQAGKEVLIKSVIQSIPTYAMGCFKLPVTLLREIQSLISNFWWHNRGQNKIHWISWQRLCDSKLQGGIGFRQLHMFNLAMLAKQLWRIHCFPDRLLSQVLKARYFPHGNMFEASLSRRPSYTWRSLMAA
ncbi:hypothetical protein Sango_2916000 [Sesamum angolense]|uniref:Endonuclease/exonuclease/phosphatase domain-containing protein n=1 Tax=Sesamum angolense TaxID=2727404 RepID=A0AAE1T5J3_9LAMI|nr:hypothetical protein Sango_2916000 [Sesamum angolense]